jgi:hypothetical protein
MTDPQDSLRSALPQLRTLDVSTAKLTDEAMNELSGLNQIEELDLSDSDVSERGLKESTPLLISS